MKINSILLYNFGSYEGETVFDTRATDDGRNIVLIGGKMAQAKPRCLLQCGCAYTAS